MRTALLVAILIVAGLSSTAGAGDIGDSAGLTLQRTASVRAVGMGGAQAAVLTDEAGAIGGNPAALESSPGASTVYYRGQVDDAFGAGSGSLGVNDNLVCGAGLMMYDAGRLELTSDWGESSSIAAQRDIQVALTGAYTSVALGTSLTAGANLKLLQSTLLDKYLAYAASVDLGLYLRLPGIWQRFQAGLVIKNIGTPIRYIEEADPLFGCAVLGLACDVVKRADVAVLAAGDLQYDLNRRWQGRVGMETELLKCLSLRLGYRTDAETAAFTLGAGLKWTNIEVNYAFSPSLVFNSTHQIGLTYAFAPLVKPVLNPAVEDKPEAEAALLPEKVKSKSGEPSEKILAQVLEVRKAGGRPSEVVIKGGANLQLRAGLKGVLADSANHPLAAIVIRQVDAEMSLADIIGLSQDIGARVIAIIEKPVEEKKGE